MADESQDAKTEPQVPPIDFTTFLLSLSASALTHLDQAKVNPAEAQTMFALARQVIDLIVMLEEKTVGNLSGEEERILGQVLYDLRLRFVAETRA